MSDSYAESSTVALDTIRKVLSMFDYPVYIILGFAYQLFFNVASADVFSGGTIMKFYGRVQVIIGVFMMFQLAMTFLRGVVEPDSFSKDKGGGSFLRRVATSLILITVLMPINTGGGNEYQKQLNNNGLLFGTLYSLQHRILSNNTIGRLVLGSGTDETVFMSDDADEQLKQSSRIFTSSVLKGFYRINLVPEDERQDTGDKDPATLNENRMCKDMDDEVREAYTRLDAEPTEIIGMVNETCNTELISYKLLFHGNKKYVFTYLPIVSCIVGAIFTIIILSFTFDVAIRAFKLAFLRLLAPIPLIKYMDPQGSGDESFKAWTKTLTSTYLDLFIRLAVVYFVIFMIQTMITKGISMNSAGNGLLRALTFIVIWIGLFLFAKQAPKFIKQALGMKDTPFSLFGGLGEVAGFGATALGTIGSFNAARKASELSDQVNGPPNAEKRWYNRGKQILAGMAGGFMGARAGVSAWQGAKDHTGRTVMDAINKRNAADVARGASGSTLLGRASATGHRLLQGEGATSFDGLTREAAQKEGIEKSAKDLFSYLEGKGKTDGANYGVTTAGIDALGGARVTGSLNEFNRLKAAALAEEQRTGQAAEFQFSGHTINAHDAVATKVEEELAYAAGDEWAYRQEYGQSNFDRVAELKRSNPGLSDAQAERMVRTEVRGAVASAHSDWSQAQIDAEVDRRTSSFGRTDNGYRQKRDTYNESIKGAEPPKDNPHSLYTEYKVGESGNITFQASKLKKTSKAAGGEAGRIKNSDSYKRQQADYGATKK